MKRNNILTKLILCLIFSALSCTGIMGQSQIIIPKSLYKINHYPMWDGEKIRGNVKNIIEERYACEKKYDIIVPQSIFHSRTISFNQAGDPIDDIETKKASYDQYEMVTKYLYDTKGNCIEIVSVKDNGDTPELVKKYLFDDKNNCIEEQDYNDAGELLYATKYKYEKDNVLKWYEQYRGDKLIALAAFTFDKSGKVISVKKRNDDNDDRFFYHDNNNLSKIQYDNSYASGGKPNIILFNEYGDIMRYYKANYDTYIYKYDDNNNWIEKQEYDKIDDNQEPRIYWITVRKIEYWE